MHVYKPPRVGGLDRVPVFTAGTGGTRADLFEVDGVTPMPGNVLVADTSGNLPSFQCASSPVYVGVSGSRTAWTPSESGDPTPSAASGAPVVRAFPFAFDSPGIVSGYDTGYAPAVGDLLLDAWFTVDEAFVRSSGFPVLADFGYYAGAGNGALMGLFRYGGNGTVSLLTADTDANSWPAGVASQTSPGAPSDLRLSYEAAAGLLFRGLPAKITQSHNIKIVVNSTGDLVTGGDPAMSAGAGTLYLVTATPLTA